MAWPRSIYNISSSQWPSTWSGWASGGCVCPPLRCAALPLLPCEGQFPKVATPMHTPPVINLPLWPWGIHPVRMVTISLSNRI